MQAEAEAQSEEPASAAAEAEAPPEGGEDKDANLDAWVMGRTNPDLTFWTMCLFGTIPGNGTWPKFYGSFGPEGRVQLHKYGGVSFQKPVWVQYLRPSASMSGSCDFLGKTCPQCAGTVDT